MSNQPRPGRAGAARVRVALATCAAFPRLADDESTLLDALQALGIAGEPAVWDDAGVDWSHYELVIVRTTWDYTPRRDEFVGWAQSVPRLLNPADVIDWNTDKRYLASLPHTVPTQFLEPGDELSAPPGDYVVKPTVSAGSRDTARFRGGELVRARAYVGRLLEAGRTVIVQPYLEAVDELGETALVFFAGRYSHAIRKGPMLNRGQSHASGLYVEENIEPREPSMAERRVADEVLDSLPWPRAELLYARVDLIPDRDGSPRLVELELTEPSLFLSYGHGAAARLAERVRERL